jgi:DNA polymerase-1
VTPLTLIDLGQLFWTNYFGPGKSAIWAFETTLEKCEWYSREYVGRTIVCADSTKSRRKELNPQYKSNRPSKPRDGIEALRDVQDKLQRLLIPVASADGYEGDDVIATLSVQAYPDEVQIIGAEKDLYSLMSERVTLVGKNGRLTTADCVRKFDVKVEQMTDFLALMGDAADCIKGVEGIGQKKAAALLAAFGDCDGVKAASDDAILAIEGFGTGVRGQKLLAAIRAWDPESALQLVRLEYDAPVSLEELLRSDADDSGFDDSPPDL